jgi:hypothetical protein
MIYLHKFMIMRGNIFSLNIKINHQKELSMLMLMLMAIFNCIIQRLIIVENLVA